MNIHAKKVQIIEWIATLQDAELLNKIDALKKQSVKESHEAGLTPMSMEAYDAMITSSEQDIKAGRLYSHEEVVSYIKNKK
jgi:predicted transcriptional regulator